MPTKNQKGAVRIDVGTLRAPKKQANGWLRVDAYLTRSGVFEYLNPDGTKRREYRPEAEVFKADSLETLHSLPVTDQHPPGLLDAKNTAEHSRGALGEQPRRDGDMVASSMLLTDADLIKKVERGDARQVSAGYTCDLDFEEGVTPKGERYDAIQTNIRYNHAAVLPRGRAGADVRVRMDAAELDVVLDPQPAVPGDAPLKIRIDGIDYDAGSEAAVQAMAKHEEKVRADAAAKDTEIAELKKASQAQHAKMDETVKAIDQMKKDAAEMPAKVRAELEARTSLESQARKVLGTKVSLDGLDARAVQGKVLAKLAPKLKLDGKDEAYVSARFDAAVEGFEASQADSEEAVEHQDGEEVEREDEGEVRLDAEEERKKLMKATSEMAKRPIGASLGEGSRGVTTVR